MKILFSATLLFYAFVFCGNANRQSVAETSPLVDSLPNLDSLCAKTNALTALVRDNAITKAGAKDSIKKYFSAFSVYKNDFDSSACYFPLAGYTAKNIGGKNGNGYIQGRFNFFDGNKHTGHAAHDIFIHDANLDGIDDGTNAAVSVLSFTGGIVVAAETGWDSTSTLRGGKYLWVYNPYDSTLTYYAHNNTLLVSIGDKVAAGDTIATVGRTGFNAHKKRSPTHLHFTQLKFDKAMEPKPINPYKKLLKAITVK